MTNSSRTALVLITATLLVGRSSAAQTKINGDAALVQTFNDRVAAYVKLAKSAGAGLPPLRLGDQQKDLPEHQKELADRIRQARTHAKPGDICSPPIAAELRRLLGLAMQGANERRVRQSLRSAEPVSVPLQINASFPDKLPLQSTPPTLLMNLPRLPAELEYRFSGRTLFLRDTNANIVVDFVPDALPDRK